MDADQNRTTSAGGGRQRGDPGMDDQESGREHPPEQASFNVERFLESTFEKLPVDSKVLIALFGALNAASGITRGFDLSERLWEAMRFNGCGPLVGQSEEVNWLKGVCDGILLVADHA